MWHTSYALYKSKIVIFSDVASGGAHHFTWHSKHVSAQYLEHHIALKDPWVFWCKTTQNYPF
jgi:hypothetical protein